MNRRTSAALVGALLLLTACIEDTGPDAEACATPSVDIALALSADALEPNDPAVCRDQDVTLVISAEVDGVFHIHGYDEAVPATEVSAGEEMRLRFTASRSGQFPIELHPQDDPAGVEIGVFTVHEP
jgi:hypothetical protein